MFQVLIVTHGELGDVLLTAAKTIAGSAPNISALCLEWEDSLDLARGKVSRRLTELEYVPGPESSGRSDGVLILTDMYGGTPFNVVREFLQPDRVEVVCGVNLPMVLRLCCLTEKENGRNDLREVARWIHEKGQRSIRLSNQAPEHGRG